MTLETLRVRNRNVDGGIEITEGAATPVPGLYVARSEYGWPIVHVRSGLLVGTYEDPEAALACAIDLGPLWDWTQAADGLRLLPRERKDEIVGTCRRWGVSRVSARTPGMTWSPRRRPGGGAGWTSGRLKTAGLLTALVMARRPDSRRPARKNWPPPE